MRTGLREANQSLAKAVRAVRSGREVDARLAALAAEGVVRPAVRPAPMPTAAWQPDVISGSAIAETVRRDRDESA